MEIEELGLLIHACQDELRSGHESFWTSLAVSVKSTHKQFKSENQLVKSGMQVLSMFRTQDLGSLQLITSYSSFQIRSNSILVKLIEISQKVKSCILRVLDSFQFIPQCFIFVQNYFQKWFWNVCQVVCKIQKGFSVQEPFSLLQKLCEKQSSASVLSWVS